MKIKNIIASKLQEIKSRDLNLITSPGLTLV